MSTSKVYCPISPWRNKNLAVALKNWIKPAIKFSSESRISLEFLYWSKSILWRILGLATDLKTHKKLIMIMQLTMWLLKVFDKIFLLKNGVWKFIVRLVTHGLHLSHFLLPLQHYRWVFLTFQTLAHVQTATQYRQKFVLPPETVTSTVKHGKKFSFCQRPWHLHVINYLQLHKYVLSY